ncbi:hypothetical protein ACIP5Y_09565 [Nocardia sp. NPDC088792]|uniref:hypothetical protein n=1 Tax=Nocardia sp. NPDC088792 TaxID=3364332 RepID=UPI003820FFC4
MDPDALRRRAQQCLQGAEHEQQRVSRTELDADYIQQLEHFGALSHAEIHRHVRAMDPAAMHTAGDTWATIADNLTGAITGLQLTVQSALTDGMQGRLATAADTAARRFARDALDIAEITLTSGRRIIAAAFAAEVVRKTVPPPPTRTTGPTPTSLPATTADLIALMTATPPGGTHDFERYREEQYRQAIAALEANYVPTYPPAGARVPAFFPMDALGDASVPAPNSFEPTDRTQPAGRYGDAAPGTPNDANISRNRQAPTDIDTANRNGTDPWNRNGTDSANRDGNDSSNHADTGLTNHDDTGIAGGDAATSDGDPSTDSRIRPASVDDPGPSTTGSPSAPYSPAVPRGPGTPGFPGDPRLLGPSTPGDMGRSYPGPAHPKAPANPIAPTRSQAPAPGSTPGLYSPGSPGVPPDDRTHKSPAWLIRDRAEELLGHPESTIAPVIGAEIPAARTDLTDFERAPR